MPQRTKFLAMGLAAVVALWIGAPWFHRAFLEPLEKLDGDLAAARKTLSLREDRELQLIKAVARLANLKSLSLPSDPLVAHRVYQEWLADLATSSGWTELKVTLDRRITVQGAYSTIPVTVAGKATRANIARFFERFEEAPLLHHVVRFTVDNTDPQGDPKLVVLAAIEGLSLVDGPVRSRLFASGELVADVSADALEITVDSTESVPPPPFLFKVDSEQLEATAVSDEQWTVRRGVGGTTAAAHAAGAEFELAPLRSESDRTNIRNNLTAWSKLPPFVKPGPPIVYRPRFAPLKPAPVVVGQPWTLKLVAEGIDPADGKPTFRLAENAPKGVALVEANGLVDTLKWMADLETPQGDATIPVEVRTSDGSRLLATTSIKVTVRRENRPPKFVVPAQPVAVYPGRSFRYSLMVNDPDLPTDRLTYSLESGAPEGLAIDVRTGALSWDAPETLELGERKAKVTVTDSGTPAQTDQLELAIQVQDDPAALVRLVACVEVDGVWHARVRDQGADVVSVVRVGAQLSIADIKLEVLEIGSVEMIVLDRSTPPTPAATPSDPAASEPPAKEAAATQPSIATPPTPTETTAPATPPPPAAPNGVKKRWRLGDTIRQLSPLPPGESPGSP